MTVVSPLIESLSAPASQVTVPEVPPVRLTVTPVLIELKSMELPALTPVNVYPGRLPARNWVLPVAAPMKVVKLGPPLLNV